MPWPMPSLCIMPHIGQGAPVTAGQPARVSSSMGIPQTAQVPSASMSSMICSMSVSCTDLMMLPSMSRFCSILPWSM